MTFRFAWLIALGLSACGQTEPSLMPSSHIIADTIPIPLTERPGDASIGVTIFAKREQGHCVLCHAIDTLDVPFQGNVGPDLSDIGARLTPAQIRLRIVDASRVNPNTVMPPYYRTSQLNQVATAYTDAPMLSAQDIEHLVAYLTSQTGRETDE